MAKKTVYEKSIRALIRDFTKSFQPPRPKGFGLFPRKPLAEKGYFTRAEILSWFKEKYPKLKQASINAHLTIMSTNAPSRLHHSLKPNGEDDFLFQMDRSTFRLYDKATDPPPIYKSETDGNGLEEGDSEEDGDEGNSEGHEFAYEKDLKNFLANNLSVVQPGLKVYQDGDISGVEFPVGGRYVDLLAVDKDNNYVVIELKVSKGYDRALAQLLRYMTWIERNLAEPNQTVRGIIIARRISEDLELATSRVSDVELFEYALSIGLKKVNG